MAQYGPRPVQNWATQVRGRHVCAAPLAWVVGTRVCEVPFVKGLGADAHTQNSICANSKCWPLCWSSICMSGSCPALVHEAPVVWMPDTGAWSSICMSGRHWFAKFYFCEQWVLAHMFTWNHPLSPCQSAKLERLGIADVKQCATWYQFFALLLNTAMKNSTGHPCLLTAHSATVQRYNSAEKDLQSVLEFAALHLWSLYFAFQQAKSKQKLEVIRQVMLMWHWA